MSFWKMTGAAPQTLPLALMFCTSSLSMMSFCTAFSYKGALGDAGVSNPEPTFQNMLHFEKPLFVSQRNKGLCIIKPLSPPPPNSKPPIQLKIKSSFIFLHESGCIQTASEEGSLGGGRIKLKEEIQRKGILLTAHSYFPKTFASIFILKLEESHPLPPQKKF